MGSLKVDVRANVRGPLAGNADQVLQEWARQTAKALAQDAAEALRQFPMDKTGRAHGGFAGNIRVREHGSEAVIRGPQIKGVTWAPWLEGTSRRNESTPFRGYHLFRKTRLATQRHAELTGQEQLGRLLPRLGGE